MPRPILDDTDLPKQDISGQKFGRLTAIGFHHWRRVKAGVRHQYWLYKCDCGTQKIISHSYVRSGHTSSCGCLHREATRNASLKHGDTRTALYKIWAGMKYRCECITCPHYPRWGGRGIKIIWDSYQNFKKDMGPTFRLGLTIERKDNNGNYSKDNCIWIPRAAQAVNRRDNVMLEFNGKRLCQNQWARRYGLSYECLCWRIRHGWKIEKALTTPTRKRRGCANVSDMG